jgi:hypothetical protein
MKELNPIDRQILNSLKPPVDQNFKQIEREIREMREIRMKTVEQQAVGYLLKASPIQREAFEDHTEQKLNLAELEKQRPETPEDIESFLNQVNESEKVISQKHRDKETGAEYAAAYRRVKEMSDDYFMIVRDGIPQSNWHEVPSKVAEWLKEKRDQFFGDPTKVPPYK